MFIHSFTHWFITILIFRVENSPTVLHRRSLNYRSPSPKSVTFNLPDDSTEISLDDPMQQRSVEPETARPPRSKKLLKNPLRITEKTNMSNLANAIIPQLNEMQKNFLGKLSVSFTVCK